MAVEPIDMPNTIIKTDKPAQPEPKFLKFDKLPQTAGAKAFADHIVGLILASESRTRRRRQIDHGNFVQQVYALTAEIACHILRGDDRRLCFLRSATALGCRDHYRPVFITEKLTDVIDALAGLFLITQQVGYKVRQAKRGIASSIAPTAHMKALISRSNLRLSDFKAQKPRQTIVLKARKSEDEKGRKIPFEETTETERLRREVDEINLWIAKADLRFDPKHNDGTPVDDSRTHLHRVFNGGSFQFHGRLYGGFWIGLSKKQRREGLTINGERVISLDYSNMMLRLAYGHAGAQLPGRADLYSVPPFDTPEWREGIKPFVNALFFQAKPMGRVPRKIAKCFPSKVSLRELKSAVVKYHSGIAHMLDTDIGHHLWITESNLIIEVLRRLRKHGITALPVHDSIIVPLSAEPTAMRIMEQTGLELVGVPCPVKPEC